jgi:hypothetical protein
MLLSGSGAVTKITEEEDRSKNVVTFGVPEDESEMVDSKVKLILAHLDEKLQVRNCSRIGQSQKRPVVPRPIRF